MSNSIVGVRFRPVGKIYNFDANGLVLEQYDHVIVDTSKGLKYGEIAIGPRALPEDYEYPTPLKPVLRLATMEDTAHWSWLKEKAEEAREVFNAKVKENNLDMKLIEVEYTFDDKKAIFYFSSEGRVDFRKLVKYLAAVFRMRIELRQIGVRDETRNFKTLGCCGRTTCCAQWMGDFSPISIRMAKEQNLSLNSTKISGVCGRLLCCLSFEKEFYQSVGKRMPKIRNYVETKDGYGEVLKQYFLKETVSIRMKNEDGDMEIRQYPLDDIKDLGRRPPQEVLDSFQDQGAPRKEGREVVAGKKQKPQRSRETAQRREEKQPQNQDKKRNRSARKPRYRRKDK
jgi:cell fate regulator YaaT (PSP1 superfamily)